MLKLPLDQLIVSTDNVREDRAVDPVKVKAKAKKKAAKKKELENA